MQPIMRKKTAHAALLAHILFPRFTKMNHFHLIPPCAGIYVDPPSPVENSLKTWMQQNENGNEASENSANIAIFLGGSVIHGRRKEDVPFVLFFPLSFAKIIVSSMLGLWNLHLGMHDGHLTLTLKFQLDLFSASSF